MKSIISHHRAKLLLVLSCLVSATLLPTTTATAGIMTETFGFWGGTGMRLALKSRRCLTICVLHLSIRVSILG